MSWRRTSGEPLGRSAPAVTVRRRATGAGVVRRSGPTAHRASPPLVRTRAGRVLLPLVAVLALLLLGGTSSSSWNHVDDAGSGVLGRLDHVSPGLARVSIARRSDGHRLHSGRLDRRAVATQAIALALALGLGFGFLGALAAPRRTCRHLLSSVSNRAPPI